MRSSISSMAAARWVGRVAAAARCTSDEAPRPARRATVVLLQPAAGRNKWPQKTQVKEAPHHFEAAICRFAPWPMIALRLTVYTSAGRPPRNQPLAPGAGARSSRRCPRAAASAAVQPPREPRRARLRRPASAAARCPRGRPTAPPLRADRARESGIGPSQSPSRRRRRSTPSRPTRRWALATCGSTPGKSHRCPPPFPHSPRCSGAVATADGCAV
jgi:hypothetical protein